MLSLQPPRHEAYLAEAARLREKYASQITILIGFEGEWIRAEDYSPLIQSLSKRADYFIGSLHHTLTIPIDYDRTMYLQAVRAAAKKKGFPAPPEGESSSEAEETLFETYFDEQYSLLETLRPKVIGHFDLIRLFSSLPSRRLDSWPGVWRRIERNLTLIKSYDGWLECNTSALRKGLEEPYPKREIAEVWARMGGKWTFSDDSHGIGQVATNYLRGLKYLEEVGVGEVWTFGRGDDGGLVERKVTIEEFRGSLKLGE